VELSLEIHPQDARRLGVLNGGKVTVTSRRSSLVALARVTATVQPLQVFLPMHDRRVNELTNAIFDPYSRQPSYKHCAVRIEKTL
jgi:assimilatory nitrate reductase catalytic subunit